MTYDLYPKFVESLSSGVRGYDKVPSEILHAVIGVTTEAGEALDAIKKSLVYGRSLDIANLDEEFGDMLWYIQLYCNQRNLDIDDLIRLNCLKLRKRYPDNEFNPYHEANRDLEAERKILEDGHG